MTDKLLEINKRWNLPKVYLEYIAKNIDDKFIEIEDEDEFSQEIRIYGNENLIKNQEGYSYNPITKKIIEVWPKNYLVIADSDADPFVLDLSKSDNNDTPVLFAYHGEGEWSFEEYSETFQKFLTEKLKL